LERLRAEGKATPADLFFVIDAGTLQIAAEEGLLQPVDSEVLRTVIPPELRDPQNRWFALTQRVRTIVYNSNKVKPSELSTYEALADRKWRGRLCMRPATHIYTISLVAGMIANLGERRAEQVVRGWVANRPTFIDSDSRILENIAAGKCDVAIIEPLLRGQRAEQGRELAGQGVLGQSECPGRARKHLRGRRDSQRAQPRERHQAAGVAGHARAGSRRGGPGRWQQRVPRQPIGAADGGHQGLRPIQGRLGRAV
jgi:hypothetical protein